MDFKCGRIRKLLLAVFRFELCRRRIMSARQKIRWPTWNVRREEQRLRRFPVICLWSGHFPSSD